MNSKWVLNKDERKIYNVNDVCIAEYINRKYTTDFLQKLVGKVNTQIDKGYGGPSLEFIFKVIAKTGVNDVSDGETCLRLQIYAYKHSYIYDRWEKISKHSELVIMVRFGQEQIDLIQSSLFLTKHKIIPKVGDIFETAFTDGEEDHLLSLSPPDYANNEYLSTEFVISTVRFLSGGNLIIATATHCKK